MANENQILVDVCAGTVSVANDAISWFTDNRETIGAAASSLIKEFRQDRIDARRLQRAAKRPMCVGVFGESQSGKSYLISALARKKEMPLTILFGQEKEIEFLKMQPESGGENEATGLVTRFTIHPYSHPPGHPVLIRLLSQTDLVKILANSYMLDFDVSEETAPEDTVLQEALKAARQAVKVPASDALGADDIYLLQHYFETEFKGRATTAALARTEFWAQLEDLAPTLPLEERVKLFEFLWGRVRNFSTLYVTLCKTLESIGFVEEAYCTLDAVADKKTSILDVNTLYDIEKKHGLLKPSGDQIDVVTASGRQTRMFRAHLAAVISELILCMKQKPQDYFEATDLLDFPGLRSRLNLQMAPEAYLRQSGEQGLSELYRRGKVGYLFDRYCTEQELTSMLLCVQPGNQNTRVLPHMALKWIHATHGKSPEERDRTETALFVVLTKFDKHFSEAAGKVAEESNPAYLTDLWMRAIDTPLLDFFGKSADKWPVHWKTGKAFNNVFWLRNPGYFDRGLIAYGQKNPEIQGSPESEKGLVNPVRIARFRDAYLKTPLIRQHVAEPEKAWDAAFSLDDGGVTYLNEKLAPLCRPDLKLAQIRARIMDLRRKMRQSAERYFVSDDGGAEKEKRKQAAWHAVENLAETGARDLFAHFVSELQIEAAKLQYLFYWSELSNANSATPTGRFSKEQILAKVRGRPAVTNGAGAPADYPRRLAGRAVEYWAEQLRRFLQDEERQQRFALQGEPVSTVVRELLDGVRRLQITEKLAGTIRNVTQEVEAGPSGMLKPAMVSAEMINRFVYRLGQDLLPMERRARVPDESPSGAPFERTVFHQRRRIEVLTEMSKDGPKHQLTFMGDWLESFQHLVEANVDDKSGTFDREQNTRLGAILSKL